MKRPGEIIRIDFKEMRSIFEKILIKNGYDTAGAGKCAEIFAFNSLDGVYSHGVNRFHRFIRNTNEGLIDPTNQPSLIHGFGSFEQWDGNLGPGPLNALFASDRVMKIAGQNGIGIVTMAHTNHWMRGGYYGWEAARKGFVYIAWTNTCPNMPAWGAIDPHLGNNPFVMAVPFRNEAIVLDFAMTQYSYGKMESYYREGKRLPFPGGYNKKGELTCKPSEIMDSWRPLPMGFWKGSAFSLLLDILATVLSSGLPTHKIKSCFSEYNVSQVYIAISIEHMPEFPLVDITIQQIIDDLKNSTPAHKGAEVRYPGEKTGAIKAINLRDGIPVNKEVWDKIIELLEN
jgi:3-dehydro-L-gulonate 2-dehydrogenase